MSLILEALKRSEAERRLGEAPDLLASVPEFAGAAPARTVPLGLIAVATTVLALAIGFAWWWFALRETPAPAPPVVAAPAAARIGPAGPSADSRTVDGTPALLGFPPNAAPTPGTAPGPAIAATPTAVPDPTAPLLPPDTVVGNSPVPVEPQAAPAMAPQPAPATAPAIAAPTVGIAGDPAVTAGSANPDVPAPPPPLAESAPPQAATPPEVVQESPASDLPHLSDLPLAVRQSLPPLVLNMHLYRATPADRVVILDGQRLGEGGAAGDIQVAEIRSDGVVLVAKGQRFLLSRLPR